MKKLILYVLLALTAFPASAGAGVIMIEVCPGLTQLETPVEKPVSRLNLSVGMGAMLGGSTFAVGGADIDTRYYTPGSLVFGGRVLSGRGGGGSSGGKTTWTGFGLVAEPLVGLHWTDHKKLTIHGDVGSYDSIGRVCDHEYTEDRYSSHVLGVQPFIYMADGSGLGGHVVWEYDWYADPHEGVYRRTGHKTWNADLRFKSAFKAGYISGIGFGGGWAGTFAIAFFNSELMLGGYYDDGFNGLLLFSLGAWVL
ncbi:MAG: hypothetical protein HY897_17420 [Deltaproteobacteria bacterium]|nr:hypothetical protein [Deltaproteobacteria bacterium]